MVFSPFFRKVFRPRLKNQETSLFRLKLCRPASKMLGIRKGFLCFFPCSAQFYLENPSFFISQTRPRPCLISRNLGTQFAYRAFFFSCPRFIFWIFWRERFPASASPYDSATSHTAGRRCRRRNSSRSRCRPSWAARRFSPCPDRRWRQPRTP